MDLFETCSRSYETTKCHLVADPPIGFYLTRHVFSQVDHDSRRLHPSLRGRSQRQHQKGGLADAIRKVRQVEQGVGGVQPTGLRLHRVHEHDRSRDCV